MWVLSFLPTVYSVYMTESTLVPSESDALLTAFRHQLSAEGLSVHTRKAYVSDLALVAQWWWAPKSLKSLDVAALTAYC